MFRNIYKIVLRNMWRYRGYTLLNILGMGIGIAALVWGYQTYRFSFSFDNFHKDRDQVYRALTYREGAEGIKGVFPMPLVKQARAEFSGISEAVRYESQRLNIRYGDNEPFGEMVQFTDPGFFNLFNFPLVSGNHNLDDRGTILITESIARKYFDNQDPIGKSLTLYSGETYALPVTVTGVLKDPPVNSTIKFDFISNFDNLRTGKGERPADDNWYWLLDAAFFKIPDPANAERLARAFDKYIPVQQKAREDWKVTGFKLITLEQNARASDIGNNGLYRRPDDSAAYGPLVLAILIFLSACLNFSNTTVSRANRRLKEIGVRKVMGSSHRALVLQLLLECSAIVVMAVFLAVTINRFWFPLFNGMFNGLKITADYFHDTSLLIFIAAAVAGTTLLAGAYPAFYISRFNPTSIFRGSVKFGGKNLFSRIMLGLQLSIALITVIAGIGFARNAKFQKDYDYGYNTENTIGVVVSDSSHFSAFRNEIAAIPQVTQLAGTRSHIGYSYRRAVAEALGRKTEIDYMEVGPEYLKTMDLKMASGRAFDKEMEGDYEQSLLITEKLAANYGWKPGEALRKNVFINNKNYTVVGVLRDFHPDRLFDPIEPVAMKLEKEERSYFLIIQSKLPDLQKVFSATRDAWKRVFPDKPFTGFYQNEIKAEAYNVTNNIAKIFFWFAIISILLTATGLFALVSLTVLKKTKEIALRKVVGAGSRHILVLINKGYFWVFIVATAIGCYGGWALTKLLLDTIFRINSGITPQTLVISVIVLFMIAGITSGIKVWQAVRTNPVKNLRAE